MRFRAACIIARLLVTIGFPRLASMAGASPPEEFSQVASTADTTPDSWFSLPGSAT